MTGKQITGWATGITATIGAIVLIFWGVPYYLQTQVRALYAAEVAAAGAPAGVTANDAAIQAMQRQLNGMELRMIARDEIQADRDAVIMQYFADKAADGR